MAATAVERVKGSYATFPQPNLVHPGHERCVRWQQQLTDNDDDDDDSAGGDRDGGVSHRLDARDSEGQERSSPRTHPSRTVTSQSVTAQASWQSSNNAVATVSAAGVVTGLAAGDADISATYQNVTGRMHVTLSRSTTGFTVSGTVTDGTSGGVLPNIRNRLVGRKDDDDRKQWNLLDRFHRQRQFDAHGVGDRVRRRRQDGGD